MKTTLAFFLFFVTVCVSSCKSQTENKLRYAALGDSYTIGTGAEPQQAWPVLLTEHLNKKNITAQLIANPARNGFSTQNLIDLELPVFDTCRADLVTLLIGVNDWVRGVDKETFEKNLHFIIEHVQSKLAQKKNLLLITIPDFGVTPEGSAYSRGRDISKGITEFNEVIKESAKKYGLGCVDIFATSRKMKEDASLVAEDGLHPSAKEYAVWEALILPEVLRLLEAK